MMHDYRKTLAMIAPGFLASDAQVWMSDGCFERLRSPLDDVIALGVEFELQRAVATPTGLDLQYRSNGSGPAKMLADQLMLALCKDWKLCIAPAFSRRILPQRKFVALLAEAPSASKWVRPETGFE